MFRPMRRPNQALPEETGIELLKNEKRGVLSVIGDDGYPYGTPINHFYNEEDGKIYFHGGKTGHRVDALCRDNKASYSVIDSGVHVDGDWALTFRSVIIFGKIEFIDDQAEVDRICRLLSQKFTDDTAYTEAEIRDYGASTLLFALVPEHMTVKRVHEA